MKSTEVPKVCDKSDTLYKWVPENVPPEKRVEVMNMLMARVLELVEGPEGTQALKRDLEVVQSNYRGAVQDLNIALSNERQAFSDFKTKVADKLCNVAQLIFGWQTDESWSDFDRECYDSVIELQKEALE